MKEMNTDFIKWMCEKADGFEYIRKQTEDEYYVGYSKFGGNYFDTGDYDRFIYPLLLQRAIEGVNSGEKAEIIQTRSNIAVMMHSAKPIRHFELATGEEDAAKESALMYVHEQEKQ